MYRGINMVIPMWVQTSDGNYSLLNWPNSCAIVPFQEPFKATAHLFLYQVAIQMIWKITTLVQMFDW